MIVYGKNVVKDIDVNKIRKVYIMEHFHDNEIIKYLQENNVRYIIQKKQVLDHMVKGNHQGIVIEINDFLYSTLDEIKDEDFIVALDHLEDVHNFGAIIRSCEAAGIRSILIPKNRSVQVNDVVMKISCGALDRVKIIQVPNLVDAIKKLQKENYFVYASFMNGEDYRKIDFSGKKILVIGNEGKGISKIVESVADFRIGIPMTGKVNSLNASVAAGILIFAMK